MLIVIYMLSSCELLNRPPKWSQDVFQYTLRINQEFTLNLASVVSDPDKNPITIEVIDGPVGLKLVGNILKWTPTKSGVYIVKISAKDSLGAVSYGTLVLIVNSSPIWKEPNYSLTALKGTIVEFDLMEKLTDIENDSIQVFLEGETYGAQITAEKKFVWNTKDFSEGIYQFKLKAVDSKGDVSYAYLTVNIITANKPPIVLSIPNQITKVGKATTIDLSLYVMDPDGDPITIQKVQGPGVILGTKYYWFPTSKITTPTNVVLKFEDGKGGATEKTFQVLAAAPGEAKLVIYVTEYKSGPANSGVTVELRKGNTVVQTKVTDESGKVEFDSIVLDETTDFNIAVKKAGYSKTYIEGLRLKDGEVVEFQTELRKAKLGGTVSDKPFSLELNILDENNQNIQSFDYVVKTNSVTVNGNANALEYPFSHWYVKVGGVPGAGALTDRAYGNSKSISATQSVKEFEYMVPVFVDLYDVNDNRFEKITYVFVSRLPAGSIEPYNVEKYTTIAPDKYNIQAFTRSYAREYYKNGDYTPNAAPQGSNLFIKVFWRPWYESSNKTPPKAYRIYRSFNGVNFEPIATVSSTTSSYIDYSAKLEPLKRVWYGVSSVYDEYETIYTVIGDVIPLPLLGVNYNSPTNGSENVLRDPTFSWNLSGVNNTSEGNVRYLYDVWLYDEVLNSDCYYSVSDNPSSGSYRIFSTTSSNISFKFSTYASGTYRWVDFYSKTWYPYSKLQARKTYEWGNELLAAEVFDSTDRSIAISILSDLNNYYGLGAIPPSVYNRFTTGDN